MTATGCADSLPSVTTSGPHQHGIVEQDEAGCDVFPASIHCMTTWILSQAPRKPGTPRGYRPIEFFTPPDPPGAIAVSARTAFHVRDLAPGAFESADQARCSTRCTEEGIDEEADERRTAEAADVGDHGQA